MRNLSLLTCAVFMGCTGLAAAQPLPPKANQPARNFVATAAVVDDAPEPRIYYPGLDPEVYVDQACYDAMEQSVFGFTTRQEVWNLDLDAVVGDDNLMTGTSRLGLPFTVQFSTFVVRNITNNPSLDRAGTWTGLIVGNNDVFYCGGFYFENNGSASIVPYYALRDQTEAAGLFSLMIETSNGDGYMSRQWQCALDSTATFQSQQNSINAGACSDSAFNYYMGIMTVCTTGGMVSCWVTFGAGCIGGVVCDGVVLVMDYCWQRDFRREWQRSQSCLCLESSWRFNNPGQPLPGSTCGTFNCPSVLPISIPKFTGGN